MTEIPDDIVPPLKQYADDILVDDIGHGGLVRGVPFWKVLLFRTMKARIINDAATRGKSADQPQHDTAPPEKLAPPVVADETAETASASPHVSPAVIAALEAKVADLTARLDRFEAERKAEEALLALEAEIEAANPPLPDDGAGLTMH
jgi:hypothetical protein